MVWNCIAVVFCISLSLSATATGLGAIFMELEVKPPAKIISGFGGTLNLVLGLAAVLLSVCPLAVIFHFFSAGALPYDTLHNYLNLAYLWMALLTVCMTVIPLALGRRVLLSRDF